MPKSTHPPAMPTSSTRTSPTSIMAPLAVDVRQASNITGFPVATLNGWRTKGGGPPFIKAGRSVRYRLADLDAWLAARVVQSTAEVAANDAGR